MSLTKKIFFCAKQQLKANLMSKIWVERKKSFMKTSQVLSIPLNLFCCLLCKAIIAMWNWYWSLNERTLMYWTNLRRDLHVKANVAESYIIKGPPAWSDLWQIGESVYYVTLQYHGMQRKVLTSVQISKIVFSRDKIFLVFDALFAAKLTELFFYRTTRC